MLRTAIKQASRENDRPERDSPETYNRRVIPIPLTDKLISELS